MKKAGTKERERGIIEKEKIREDIRSLHGGR